MAKAKYISISDSSTKVVLQQGNLQGSSVLSSALLGTGGWKACRPDESGLRLLQKEDTKIHGWFACLLH